MKVIRNYWRELTLRPQGVTVVVAAFLPIFAIVSMFPLVPVMIQHFAEDPDARSKVPLMVTAPGLTIAILAPFAGFVVDRFGRRRLLLLCTFFYGIFGTAPFFLRDLDAIFISRLLLGVTEAGILTIVNTIIADYWDDTGRRNWLFLQGLVGPFAGSMIVLLTGTFASISWNAGFLVYLIAFPVYLAMLVYIFEPKKPEAADEAPAEAPAAPHFPMRQALKVAALTLFTAALYYVFIVNGGLVFKEVGVEDPHELSLLYTIPSLFVLVGAVAFRLMAARPYPLQVATVLGLLGIGLAGMGLSTGVAGVLVSMAIQQTGAGMAIPTLIAWAQRQFPFEHRGRGMGIWTSAFFLGQFVSPWFVHRFDLASGSTQGAFVISGACALIVGVGAIAVAFGGRRRPPDAKPSVAG